MSRYSFGSLTSTISPVRGRWKSAARDIQKRVNSYYVSEKDKDVKKIYVEPVFIMGLRKTVEKLVNENDG